MSVHWSSTYSPETAKRICDAIANGLSLRKAAEAAGVKRSTAMKWVSRHDEFGRQYAQARAEQLDLYADDIVELSDSAQGADSAGVQAVKLRTDNRKWILSKLRADVYGDRLDVTSAGKALAPPTHQIDARVQSIVMQATERMRLAQSLDSEAQALLD